MNLFLKESFAMKDNIIENRRYIHENAELGFDLPKTRAFVIKQLTSLGYAPILLGEGITCTIGSGQPVILLRADMDALPQTETSGLDFACQTGACHSCGHDAHTAMLLAAAALLRKHADLLKGTVKLMFQAGEETLLGSRKMLDAGILDYPKVDAAMALHMNFGPCGDYDMHAGSLAYSAHTMMPSADEFRITIKGKASHGSTPYLGVSAASAAANIVVALQQLISLEIPCDEPVILSIGKLTSGTASNIIPEEAEIMGSFRAFTRENREYLRRRLPEVATSIAESWRANAKAEFLGGVAPNINDPDLAKEMAGYCSQIMEKVQVIPPVKGSEDFANLCEYVPTFFANVCAGSIDEGYAYSMHNPSARLDENALPYGSAVYAFCAVKWLENHSIAQRENESGKELL